MNQVPYPFTRFDDRYIFVSTGENEINKVVEFSPMGVDHCFNLCFGDLPPDSTIDDTTISNNADIGRVLITVISISINFLETNHWARIFFMGRTDVHTVLYKRIVKTYYYLYSSKLAIAPLLLINGQFVAVRFDSNSIDSCIAFYIRRKI